MVPSWCCIVFIFGTFNVDSLNNVDVSIMWVAPEDISLPSWCHFGKFMWFIFNTIKYIFTPRLCPPTDLLKSQCSPGHVFKWPVLTNIELALPNVQVHWVLMDSNDISNDILINVSTMQNYEANCVVLHFLFDDYSFDDVLMKGNISHNFYICSFFFSIILCSS